MNASIASRFIWRPNSRYCSYIGPGGPCRSVNLVSRVTRNRSICLSMSLWGFTYWCNWLMPLRPEIEIDDVWFTQCECLNRSCLFKFYRLVHSVLRRGEVSTLLGLLLSCRSVAFRSLHLLARSQLLQWVVEVFCRRMEIPASVQWLNLDWGAAVSCRANVFELLFVCLSI